jgi:MFS family permease
MVLTTYSYGAVLTIIADLGIHVGMASKDKGYLFAVLTIASLAVRLLAGKASDRFGRKEVLIVSTFLGVAGMMIIGVGTLPIHLMIGIACYGLANGMTSPTLFAWATDLSDPNKRGKGLSSLYIFMELGIGLGAIFSGWIYSNDTNRFFITFIIAGAIIAIAFMFLIFLKLRKS